MTMITPSYLGETIEYSSLHACRSTLEDPTPQPASSGVYMLPELQATQGSLSGALSSSAAASALSPDGAALLHAPPAAKVASPNGTRKLRARLGLGSYGLMTTETEA